MEKRCDICGVKLKIVKGKWYCPNHGIVEIDSEESNGKERGYIG